MSTITYNNTVYTQVFIDPSKTVAGDGTTPANALFDFPVALADNTCYVIRRTNETPNTIPQIPNGTYDFKNLMICGMPKPTDAMYKYMNQLEKDAWGADEFDYAMCRVNNTTASQPAVTLSAISDFIINRCYLFRDDNNLTNDSIQEFAFNITNADANTKIDNCKFGYLGDNFDDDAWLAANSAPNTKNRPRFIYAPNTYSVSVSNCVFNSSLRYQSSSSNFYSSLFCVSSVVNLYLYNNIFNICSSDNNASTGSRTEVSVVYADRAYNASIVSNTFNLIDYSNVYFPHPCILYLSPEAKTTSFVMDNTKVRYKEMKDNVASPYDYSNALFYVENLTHYSVTNFDLDFSNSPYFGLGTDLYLHAYYSRSPNNKIDNISIKYNTSSTVGSSFYSERISSFIFRNSSKISYAGVSNDLPIYNPSICKATNVNILIGYGWALNMYGTCVEANTIRGAIYLGALNYLKANKLINPKGNDKLIGTDGYCCSTISVDTIEVVKDDVKYPYDPSIAQIQFYDNSVGQANNVFINHSNALPFNLTLSSGTNKNARDASWVANDYNGLFVARNISASAKSWGVTRTGTSAKASFKLETTVNDINNELTLGCNPCTGFLLTPTETGTKTITAYFGSSNTYNSFAGISSKIWLEAFVPQADGSVKVYNSITQGAIEQDTSVWEGDSGVKPLKVVLPVDVKTTDDIEVKVHFHWYDSIGYTYLDPELHLD